MAKAQEIVAQLRRIGTARNREGIKRFGIYVGNAVGVSVTDLRKMGRLLGRDHKLSQELWRSGVHEARILASIVDEPSRVTEAQMERWVRDFDSWDLCDQVCGNLFDKTPFAYDKAAEWSERRPEFQKRAGFALMACLAWHDKDASDARFRGFLPLIEREAGDDRNFVKKAVNWALRQIGKRSPGLRRSAIASAKRIAKQGSRSARWIASDALRELNKTAS